MAEDTADDLDNELDSYLGERPSRPCKYSRIVPEDLKARIRKRVEEAQSSQDDKRGAPKWAGLSRFLNAPGRELDIPPEAIKQHFHRGHSDDR